jgi:methionyl-tRNA formyltransferase
MNKISQKPLNIAFFGTPDRAVIVLEELANAGIKPNLVVTQPDRPQGRKLLLTKPAAKIWAEKAGIKVLQPEHPHEESFLRELREGNFDVFVVVAYGKILKKELLDIPKHGSLNLHASMLPLLRGSCPIETAILENMQESGISIILMDEMMDHGPLIAQKTVKSALWPIPADEFAHILLREGGKLFADILPQWVEGKITPLPQDHSKATYTKKITKEKGLLDLSADPYKNFLAWNAYKGWPGSFFFEQIKGKQLRITVTDAAFENGSFVIKKVVPEGKKEMSWGEFERMK